MRMNLTEEEAKLILRQREVQDAHRAGWNKALEQVHTFIEEQMWSGDTFVYNDLLESIARMKK